MMSRQSVLVVEDEEDIMEIRLTRERGMKDQALSGEKAYKWSKTTFRVWFFWIWCFLASMDWSM